jgi:antitoxin (DNA-binding transcriptional repressor) of toxin-antitoxin stability system
MKTLELARATDSLAKYARKVSKEPVVLTVGGKPVAALVGIENADAETVALSTSPRFIALIERSRARQKSEGGISGSEMRRRLGLKRKARPAPRKKRARPGD